MGAAHAAETARHCLASPTSTAISRTRPAGQLVDTIATPRRASASTPQLIDNTLYDAFGQRQVSTMYTALNQYHVVMEVAPQFWQNPRLRCSRSTCARPNGPTVPLSAFTHYAPRHDAAGGESSGAVPRRHALVQSGARRRARRRRRPRSTRLQRRSGLPATIHASFAGTAQAFQDSLAQRADPDPAALLAVYIVLGILYESYIHPITILSTLPSAGVGALLALMICHTDLSVIAHDRHHPADRHRQEERDHDDRFRAGGRAQRRQEPRATPSTGLPAALPARS